MFVSFVITFAILGTLFIINQFINTCIKCVRLVKDYEEEEEEEMTESAKRMYT
jgi:hypothetical protein